MTLASQCGARDLTNCAVNTAHQDGKYTCFVALSLEVQRISPLFF